MVRNYKWISFLTATLLVIQFIAGGLLTRPESVNAASGGPVAASLSPSPNATNVPTNGKLILTFDEAVKKGTGSVSIQIRKQVDNSLFDSFLASDGRVAVNGNIVTISPSANFALNTAYYVTIDAGAFANVSNSANYAGLSSATDWRFTTVAVADTTPPVINATTPFVPANGATAEIGTQLTLNFSEPVYAATGYITVTNIAQPSDSQAISVNTPAVTGSSSASVTIALTNVLRGSSTYEVLVPSGAFQDAAGNAFAGVAGSQWRFTTTAPPLGNPTLQPADDAYGVSVSANLVLSFPIKVTANSGTITINKIADNSTVQTIAATSGYVTYVDNAVTGGTDVTINPPADLAANTGFYVLIDGGAFKGAADPTKLFQGISDARAWSFTTDPGNDTTPPNLLADRKPLTTQTTQNVSLELNFSEPVYPGAGNITIKSLPSGAVFTTIPVTSSKVTGGGTTKITVTDATKTYANNTRYYVEIGGQAFSDARGNYYAGISGSGTWSYMVTQDSVKPSLLQTLPANTAQNVVTQGAILEATFSEPIVLGATANAIMVKRISGSGSSPLATTATIDPTNNSKLRIAVSGTMAPSVDYYVEIPAGAVNDLAGNAFDGILNQYQWTFKTTNSANGAPTVTSAALSGTTKIVITFNENLDSSAASTPLPANFYVTVNGSARSVTGVAISGQNVTLTLSSAAAYGQTVKVSYSVGTNPIKDLSGTAAASFSNVNVTNVPDTTAPTQVSGSVNGNTVILTFSEELQTISPYAYSQFSMNVSGTTRTVTQATNAGNIVFLTFSGSAPAASDTVAVSYYGSSYPLRDLAGNALYAFSSFYVQNGLNNTAPALQSISSSGAVITLIYNEALNPGLVPYASSFYVTVNGYARSVSYVSVSGSQVMLTLSTATSLSDSVLVSYLGGTPALTDLGGMTAPAFASMPANGGGTSTLALNGIIAKGSTITVSFSSTLSASYPPSTTQFAVKVNGATRPISGATISGSSVLLTLYTPVAIGDTVYVSYSNAGLGPRSVNGALPVSFTDAAAANQTTWSDNINGDYESAADGGLGIKASAASTQSGSTPAGASVNRYVLTAEKITNAFNTIRSTSGLQPRVVFTVPSTENAAQVALPLGALEDARKLASNASIAVVYKSVTYEIPLSALNFAQLAQMMNAASAVGQLIVSIDTNAGSLASSLTAQLNGVGAMMLVSPVSFDLAVTNGALTKTVDGLSAYVTRTIKTATAVDGHQAAVVWLDPQTGKLSYVPTQVTQSDGQSVIKFKRKGNSVYTVIKGSTTYSDIAKHWARNDILLMANKFIVEGNTLTTFAPDKAITRGEFAMFIAKGLGLSGDRTAAAKFKDVNTSTSLSAYIGAAATAGIVQGMTDGTFKPNNSITREEMATMMVRAATAAGFQMTAKNTASVVLKKFKDSGKIGTWAQKDVALAVEASIINGQTANSFGAKNKATRAEAAVMVKRLLSYLNFLDL